jgi:hypothetical protein
MGSAIRRQLADLGLEVINLGLQGLEVRAASQSGNNGESSDLDSELHNYPLWVLNGCVQINGNADRIAVAQLDHNQRCWRNRKLHFSA